jgi:DNA (cytosine-5)-methyltransferase 1
VFVIAIFDPVLAERCPETLLPVAESLPGHLAKGKPASKSAAGKTATSVGTDGQWWDGRDTAEALTTTSNEQRMPDKQRFQAIVEGFTPSSFANYAEGVGTLRSNGGDLGGGSETLVTEPMLIDGTRVDDVRIYEEPVQTLKERMRTGGNNVPVIGFSHTQGLDAQPSEKAWPTLRKEGSGHAVAIPIQDGRDIEKHQNGLGVGDEHSPAYTIDQTGAQAVAYPIHPQATSSAGNSRTNKDGRGNGLGIGDDGDPSTSVVGGTPPMVGQLEEPMMAVRRLTPLECERLMGWPDDHTRWKADGTEQADTHRYKQCGNGVASPVAQWIAKHLLKI